MGFKAFLIVLALLTLLAGCTTTRAPIDNPRQVWCDTNQPRRDYTPETPRNVVDQINAHNYKGVKWCNWKP
jgi:hypothetical protein